MGSYIVQIDSERQIVVRDQSVPVALPTEHTCPYCREQIGDASEYVVLRGGIVAHAECDRDPYWAQRIRDLL